MKTIAMILSALFFSVSCSQVTQTAIDTVNEEQTVSEIAGTVVEYSAGMTAFSMIAVPGGISFPTGTDDSGRETMEAAFMIGETEITYNLWSTVRTWAQSRGYVISSGQAGSQETSGGGRPYAAANTQEPVTNITWFDAAVWCNALTEWINAQTGTSLKPAYYYRQGGSLCKSSGNLEAFARENSTHQFGSAYADPAADGFRLPASKEWELAARWQGSKTVNAVNGFSNPYFCRGDSASGDSVDYTNETAARNLAVYNTAKTASVGSKAANGLGLFDMSGNVYEWCYDWSNGCEGVLRVTRGGCFLDLSYYMQIGLVGFAAVDAAYSVVGFRVVRALQ